MLKKSLLIAVALLVSLLLAEGALRIFAPDLGRPDNRLLLTTEAPSRDDLGAIRYAPHRSIRSVLMYGDEIEVDARYRTNDFGVFDHVDYLPAAKAGKRYAFVGDSYAAGVEGARRWIPALRETHGIEAYALGIGGTGVHDFELMLRSASRQLHFTDVVYVAITDDFYRTLWRLVMSEEDIRLCADTESDQDCARRTPAAYWMRIDSSPAELVVRAREIHAKLASKRSAASNLLRNSRVLHLATFVAATQIFHARRRPMLAESLASLKRVRQAYPAARIRFIHVPDRHETARGKYELDPAPLLAGSGIEYMPVLGTCAWSMERYFPRDNHPSPAGYEALRRCVAGMLGLQPVGNLR